MQVGQSPPVFEEPMMASRDTVAFEQWRRAGLPLSHNRYARIATLLEFPGQPLTLVNRSPKNDLIIKAHNSTKNSRKLMKLRSKSLL